MAQDDIQLRQIYSQAVSDLQTGRTEEARDTLLQHLGAFRGTLKRDALRIIAMSCISDYDEQGADVDGFVAKVEAGNHGQVRGDLLFGKRYFDRAVGWSRWLPPPPMAQPVLPERPELRVAHARRRMNPELTSFIYSLNTL